MKRIRRAARGRCVLFPFTREEREVYRTISCLDIYAHASRIGECFGNALAEAMALGLPVVTRSTPHPKLTNGQIEQVDHGRTGYVADTADTYAAAVEALVRDPALRARMGAAGRARIETAFSPAALTRRLEGLVLLVLERRGNALSKEEADLLESVRPELVVSPARFEAMLEDLRQREANVYGPPTPLQRLRERAGLPLRLLQRCLDKRERGRARRR